MAANTDPLFVGVAQLGFALLTGANTSADFTSQTNAGLLFTAGTNGSLLREVRAKFQPGTATAAAALRIWGNNGGALGTAANNYLIGETSLPSTTASTTAAQPDIIWVPTVPGLLIPSGHRIYAVLGAYSTGGIYAIALGGDF